MHNNYYFLTHLTKALQKKLKGSILIFCICQNKNELVLGFHHNPGDEFYIKASLQAEFSCLAFPSSFIKARRNYVALFPDIINKKVIGIRQFENERAFSILLQDDYQLLFKMFGNYSNILIFKHMVFKDMFVHKRSKDAQISLSGLDRPIDQSKDDLIKSDLNLKNVYPTFNTNMLNHLAMIQKNNKDVWMSIQILLKEINTGQYYICVSDESVIFSMYKTGDIQYQFTDPIDALNKFYQVYSHKISFEKEKTKLTNTLVRQQKKLKAYIKTTTSKLHHITTTTPNNHIGDIIMANMNTITKGRKSVNLHNFYTNESIKITLDPKISPQLNAARYYRMAKSHDQNINRLEDTIRTRKDMLTDIEAQLENISGYQTLKQIKALAINTKSKQNLEPAPFKQAIVDGYHIYIGKNAKRNDELTFKIAKKDDLFLHIKDATGSHVIIKQQPGKVFPEKVISRAAQFAAFYSKRKNENLCAVLYTFKKFVRKKKGSPAGAVIVEKEKIILVTPLKES